MPIESISTKSVQQRCIHCRQARALELEQLEIGILEAGGTAATVVSLPACAGCQTVEFLFGSSDAQPEHPSPGSYGHLHGLLVNRLHAELLDADQVSDESRSRTPRLKRPSDEVLARWFPHRLTLDQDLPSVTGGTAP
jgi:hypothetical protein